MGLIGANLAAAVFVLAILLIRRCFQHKVGWKYLYALWLMIPLRLFVLPFVKLELPFGQWKWIREMERVVSGTEMTWRQFGFFRISFASFMLAVWLLGFFVVLAYSVRKAWKVFDVVRKYSKPAKEWENGLEISLLAGENIAFLFANTIYVSERIYENKEWMKYIILHETEHKKQMDQLWDIVRGLLLCFFWYNPFIWLACLVSKQDSEFSCDERVAGHLSDAECRQYCKALLEIATRRTYEYNDIDYGLGLIGGRLKPRIINLCGSHSYKKGWRIGVTVAALLLLILTLQNYDGIKGKNQNRDYVITIIDTEL